jgi:hypothetical protein
MTILWFIKNLQKTYMSIQPSVASQKFVSEVEAPEMQVLRLVPARRDSLRMTEHF